MENNINGFQSKLCQLPTNKSLQITYVPNSDTIYYTYYVYKDSKLIRTVAIDNNKETIISLDSSGKFSIMVECYLQNGEIIRDKSCQYIVDKEKPLLLVGEENLTMVKGSKLDVMGDVVATDNIDGSLNTYVMTNVDELDFSSLGKKELTYTVSDRAGNMASQTVSINVVEDPILLFGFQSFLLIILIFILAYVVRYQRSLSLEKRIEKFSINPLVDDRTSIYDGVKNFFERLVESTKSIFEKSVFLTKLSKKYDKYTEIFDIKDGRELVVIKFLTAFVILFIAACSKAIQLKLMGFYEMWIPLVIGFFLPDLLFISKYKFHDKQMENDLLQAIVIMNNAFKSGRSITQAIYLVTTELSGPITKEFEKMHMEIQLGLGIDEVFRRFSKRIGLEEATYLTASLSIINKTGGNIIRVFDSIEKTLVNKKKLRLELNSLTGGSKIIVNVLFFVPLLFVLFVSVVSPDYFLPLFTNPFGILLLVFMILYYIIYIVCIKWIMKVRM